MKAAELMGEMSIHKIREPAPRSFNIPTINILLVFKEISKKHVYVWAQKPKKNTAAGDFHTWFTP